MAPNVTFRSYRPTDKKACLELFDANCPEFFAPNERTIYENFLEANPDRYEVCSADGPVIGAFGLMGDGARHRLLSWILLSPFLQGLGIGATIMERVVLNARMSGVQVINIGASHKSAPFCARFGANEITVTDNGWGPGMHRVDMELKL